MLLCCVDYMVPNRKLQHEKILFFYFDFILYFHFMIYDLLIMRKNEMLNYVKIYL